MYFIFGLNNKQRIKSIKQQRMKFAVKLYRKIVHFCVAK